MSTPGPGANAGQLAWAQNDTVPPDASSTRAKHRKPAAARPRAAGAHGQPGTSVMHGLHMRVMDDHVEAVITEHPLLA